MTSVPDFTDSRINLQKVSFLDGYGLRKVDTKSLLKLTKRLREGGMDLILKYITDKAGYDYSDLPEK